MVDAREAIKLAKQYFAEVFGEEGIMNIGLEEIVPDGDDWEVTMGFSRPWDKPTPGLMTNFTAEQPAYRRTYKIVTVKADGSIDGVRNRVGLT